MRHIKCEEDGCRLEPSSNASSPAESEKVEETAEIETPFAANSNQYGGGGSGLMPEDYEYIVPLSKNGTVKQRRKRSKPAKKQVGGKKRRSKKPKKQINKKKRQSGGGKRKHSGKKSSVSKRKATKKVGCPRQTSYKRKSK